MGNACAFFICIFAEYFPPVFTLKQCGKYSGDITSPYLAFDGLNGWRGVMELVVMKWKKKTAKGGGDDKGGKKIKRRRN